MIETRSSGRSAAKARRSFVVGRSLDALDAIRDPWVSVVLIERLGPSHALASALASFARTGPSPASIQGRPADLRADRLVADGAPTLVAAYLTGDVLQLVDAFARAADRDHVRVQLGTSSDDGCRKFHADQMGLRMLVTYSGPGTEWLANENVHREELGRGDLDAATNNARIVRSDGDIRRAQTHDVLLLKGDAYGDGRGGHLGAVHRSPPIEGLGIVRLVLKIDVPSCGC